MWAKENKTQTRGASLAQTPSSTPGSAPLGPIFPPSTSDAPSLSSATAIFPAIAIRIADTRYAANVTATSFTVQTNSTNAAQLIIGAGKTLTPQEAPS